MVGQSSMRGYFDLLPWIFLFLIPAVSMRLWAEEKKLGTDEILLTWPVKDWEVVVGKFLASFIFLLITLAGSLIIPVILFILGTPDLGVIIGGYLGAIFMMAAYLAIGLYASSLTNNQIVAFIAAVAVSFVLYIIGREFVLIFAPSFLTGLLRYAGLSSHFDSIVRGVIDSRDIVYYLSVVAVFLLLNLRSIQSRYWK